MFASHSKQYQNNLQYIRESDVFLASYPRSGNTWIGFLLSDIILQIQGLPPNVVDLLIPDSYVHDIRSWDKNPTTRELPCRIIKTHEPFDQRYRNIIYLFRNPADSLCSYYHFAILEGHLQKEQLSVDQFCLINLPHWCNHLASYIRIADERDLAVSFVSYELLQSQPIDALRVILTKNLGYQLDDVSILKTAIERQSFGEVKKRASEGHIQSSSHPVLAKPDFYRKGKRNSAKEELHASTLQVIAEHALPIYQQAKHLEKLLLDAMPVVMNSHPPVGTSVDTVSAKQSLQAIGLQPSSQSGSQIKLHLGCGPRRLPGFIHVDTRPEVQPDIVADIASLHMFEDNSVDLIYFCHGLEHVRPHYVQAVLSEWKRILKPNGTLRLSLPDFQKLAHKYVNEKLSFRHIGFAIYGGQDYPDNTHFWAYDPPSLSQALTNAGFTNLRRFDAKRVHPAGYMDHSIESEDISLNVEATKPDRLELLLATSIAPKNAERQYQAVQSWKALGFAVASFNGKEEMNNIESIYPNVSFRCVERDAMADAGRPLVYLEDMLRHLHRYGPQVCGIINSDIVLNADQNFLEFLFEQAQDSLVIASRLDVHDHEKQRGEIYFEGFDLFVFSKKFIELIPPSTFCLGMPWWDYFLPLMAIKNSFPVKRLTSPIAHHAVHPINYSQKLWLQYGIYFSSFFDSALVNQYQELLKTAPVLIAKELGTMASVFLYDLLYRNAQQITYPSEASTGSSLLLPEIMAPGRQLMGLAMNSHLDLW